MEERANLQFGAVAIKLGFATLEQLDECLRLQEKMKSLGVAPKKIGEILIAKAYLTEAQVREIFKWQGLMGGHTQIAGYKILTKIGHGATGSIYKALQISMDRIVAVKVLSPRYAQNEKFRDRFLKEARAVAQLNHPNIIQGIDVGESNGLHYFTMEFVDGPNVGDILKKNGAMEERKALNIVSQVARALQHAHSHGIIHRDVKPDNILLTRESVPKLCDLGLVKSMNDAPGAAPTVQRVGTPHYISPEQARGESQVDHRSDIYSLGATLFHMIVGETAYPGDDAGQVMGKHLHQPVPSPRQRNRLVSAGMDRAIMKMMAKRREERYQSYDDVLKDLATLAAPAPAPAAHVHHAAPARSVGAPSPVSADINRQRFLRSVRRLRRR